MTVSLANPEIKIDAGFSVLYSGGLDSTAVPLILGEKFTGDIHLLTLDHNYGHFFVRWSEKHARDLSRIYGEDRVFHEIYNITPIFKQLAFGNFWKDFNNYGHFIWCLGCILSIVTRMIAHNIKNKIPYSFVCSSVGGEYSIMSMPVSISTICEVTQEFGIDYRAPLLELDIRKPEEREILAKHNVHPGYKIITKGVQGVQPICMPGHQHILDNLFDIHTTYDPEKVRAFILSRKETMTRIAMELLEAEKVDVSGNIEQMKAHHESLK